ncbi:MAG TPA: hypothetical protein VJP80_07300 [Candidatus Saccharimonadales bacterium]|nr:hypothetical protein [Candidatus Saccharimonadales bacterium]
MREFSHHGEEPADLPFLVPDVPIIDDGDALRLSIEEFEGYRPLDHELPVARDMLDTAMSTARDRYDQYVLHHTTGEVLSLDYRTEDAMAHLKIINPSSYDGEVTLLMARFVDAAGNDSPYAYLPESDSPAVVRTHSSKQELLGFPEIGTLSRAAFMEQAAEVVEEQVPNLRMERAAFPIDHVGVAEANRIAAILERAEPSLFPVQLLNQMAANRVYAEGADGHVTLAEGQDGAESYLANMAHYLANPDSPRNGELSTERFMAYFAVIEPPNRDSRPPIVQFTLGQPPTKKMTALFSQTELAQDSQLVAMQTDMTYGISEGSFAVGYVQNFVDSQHRVTPISRRASRANEEDAWALQHFLRKPTV